jgi:hypothetical protein
MLKLILLAAVVFFVLAVIAALKHKDAGEGPLGVYYLRKSLLTPAERSFLGVLDPLLPSEVRIFAKVGLDDIFGVKSGLDRGARQGAINRINRKHVDFLIVRANDLVPLAGIELDDSSHEAEDRKQRDVFVDSVFKSGGIPLLHVPAQKSYSPAELKSKIAALLS